MPDQDLDERAARAMRWKPACKKAGWLTTTGFWSVKSWSPSTDHNHAHLLYAEVVRRDKVFELADRIVDMPPQTIDIYQPYELIPWLLDLTPAQLTLACCEVLEADNERNKQ